MITAKIKTASSKQIAPSYYEPSIGSKRLNQYKNGDSVTAVNVSVQEDGSWYQLGVHLWIHEQWLIVVRSDVADSPSAKQIQKDTKLKTGTLLDVKTQQTANVNQLKAIRASINNMVRIKQTVTTDPNVPLKNMRSIFGIPYQFLKSTDQRALNSDFGMSYMENIMSDLPVAIITPGSPKFLSTLNFKLGTAASQGVIKDLAAAAHADLSATETALKELLGGEKNVKYYGFEEKYPDYIEYVNSMARMSSYYLGIQNETLFKGGKPFKSFDWRTASLETGNEGTLERFFGINPSIKLYFTPGSGFNDRFTNSTDKSALESTLNGTVSKAAREAQFLLNGGLGVNFEKFSPSQSEQAIYAESLRQADINQRGLSGVFNRLKTMGTTTVLSGANLLFPEIWNDSSYTNSYSLNVKLYTPYGNPKSIYLDILIPLFHILALAMPRSFGSANSYLGPFILQAYAKGMFNCDMGIVDSISITRANDGDSRSFTGIPTELDVTIDIKDLFPAVSMSTWGKTGQSDAMFYNNTGFIDFLASFTSTNLNRPDIIKKLDMFITSRLNGWMDNLGNLGYGMKHMAYKKTKEIMRDMLTR